MAKTFNGSIWGNLGNTIFREDALRRERNQDSMNNLMDAAKFIEKVNANRNLRNDWQNYFKNRNANNIFGVDSAEGGDQMAASIWDDSMASFDPNTASPEEIRKVQTIIGTTPSGIWDRESRAAYSKYMGV